MPWSSIVRKTSGASWMRKERESSCLGDFLLVVTSNNHQKPTTFIQLLQQDLLLLLLNHQFLHGLRALGHHGHYPQCAPLPPNPFFTIALPPSTDMKAASGQVRAILSSGKMLFTTHGDCKVRIWDASTAENFRPKKVTTLPQRNRFLFFSRKSSQQHNDHISCLAYNKEDKLLYTGSWDKTVKAWKINERCCVDSFVAHEGQVNGIVINQEDGCVFTCSSDGSVKIWRRVFGESSHILTMTLKFQLSPVNALALSSSPNTTLLYSGSSDGLINFWEKEKMSGRYNHGGFLQGHHFAVLCLVALGELVFKEGNCFHSCISVIEGHHGPVRCLAVSLETENVVGVKGLLVYSASLDQTFKVWRVKVFPTEKVNMDESAKDPQREIVECETSPVLSPSWVEKKLLGNYFQ
ncbi:hypothetical protein PRUPE_3G063300 [Prunus persica]|uniref:Uncharacterized protein n=1 Tax=Prunus persica TaxID=3760 RepID=A0A251PW89_PRUPE|nr:hypothetical protein PRUPE_3G063300 [Prunus persica]